ncbi:SMI1/KNR4 family protein [Vallitalea maricola]|uniref:Uncharacterized protein n=1 Tax=Vallitalea maricola TaxID=3074433 RepID=A0ACB5UPW7_9FIRM|nr:hypothetical protein AN2V17_38370 [Vallitalea sp. AN17-2]
MNIELFNGETIEIDKVRELEKILNVKFPEDYVQFIIENNGAYVIRNDAFMANGRIESINNFHSIQEHYHFTDDEYPKKVISIARDA